MTRATKGALALLAGMFAGWVAMSLGNGWAAVALWCVFALAFWEGLNRG